MTLSTAGTFDVAVIGATGVVGEQIVALLEERAFPVGALHVLASERSAGRRVEFRGRHLRVETLETFDMARARVCLFAAGARAAGAFVPRAVEAGCVVVDCSSRFRDEPGVPLVVPEVNGEAVAGHATRGIVAGPGAATVQLVVALAPIHEAAGIARIDVVTCHAVSGTGRAGVEALAGETAALLNARPVEPRVYPRQIAFNVLPAVDEREENGYTRAETALIRETRKIFGDGSIPVNATCARVPVFFGHSAAVHVETREKLDAAAARELLEGAAGVEVMDEPADGGYPTAATDSAGADAVLVGRIREDVSRPNGLDLWVVSDNVRRGAALNSVRIAEILAKDFL